MQHNPAKHFSGDASPDGSGQQSQQGRHAPIRHERHA